MNFVSYRDVRAEDGRLLFMLCFANGERWISIKGHGCKILYFVKLKDILDDNDNQLVVAVDPKIVHGRCLADVLK